MARKSGFVRRNGVMRRETVWAATQPANAVVAGNTAVLITTLNAAALALRPFTVIRTRGRIGVFSDQVIASESYGVAYGHAVVSSEASAIGVTAVPNPIADMASDLWYVHELISGRFTFISGVGVEANDGQWKDFDSKAMRRVNGDQDLISIVEANANIGQTFHAGYRFLLKLH